MDFPTVRDVAKAISANNKAVEKRIEEGLEVVTEKIIDVEKRFIETVQEVKQEAISSHAALLNARNSRDLTPSYSLGKRYRVGEIIRHNGGVWQAFLDTEKAPGEHESGWVPYINGIASHRVEIKDVRSIEFVTALSNGDVEKAEHKMPVPLHAGKWDQGKAYDRGDMVMWDGCTWYCNANSNTDEPGLTKDWLLAAQRGERGKKGETGIRGEKGDRGERGEPGKPGADANPLDAAAIVIRAIADCLRERVQSDV